MWIFSIGECGGEKTQDQSFTASGVSSFFLSEVREELEKLVSYSLAGTPGAAGTGSLRW